MDDCRTTVFILNNVKGVTGRDANTEPSARQTFAQLKTSRDERSLPVVGRDETKEKTDRGEHPLHGSELKDLSNVVCFSKINDR